MNVWTLVLLWVSFSAGLLLGADMQPDIESILIMMFVAAFPAIGVYLTEQKKEAGR